MFLVIIYAHFVRIKLRVVTKILQMQKIYGKTKSHMIKLVHFLSNNRFNFKSVLCSNEKYFELFGAKR